MELNNLNVKKTFDDMKDHLKFHNVTAEFVDIDYSYSESSSPLVAPTSVVIGPVIKYKVNDKGMNWYIDQTLSEDFPSSLQSVCV